MAGKDFLPFCCLSLHRATYWWVPWAFQKLHVHSWSFFPSYSPCVNYGTTIHLRSQAGNLLSLPPWLLTFNFSPSPWDLPTPHLEYLPTIQSDAFFLPAQKRINILLYRALIWAATGVSCVLAKANHCLSLNLALALRVEPKALNAILGMLYHVTHDPPLSSSLITLPSL